MEHITDPQLYLERMARALNDKLRVEAFIPADARTVLDVGCSDGALTIAMAIKRPDVQFVGIDLNADFIAQATTKAAGVPNVTFECIYLRQVLARPERFDVVTFCSVLHEFYTYGEGISSVLKGLADAHEMLEPGGQIIIRDMMLGDYARSATLHVAAIAAKIAASPWAGHVPDFVERYGALDTLANVNHYLLKYPYANNWQHELGEYYVAVTFEQYEQIFKLLGMVLQIKDSYLLPYLRDKWQADFGLSEDELGSLRSTGLLVAQKR